MQPSCLSFDQVQEWRMRCYPIRTTRPRSWLSLLLTTLHPLTHRHRRHALHHLDQCLLEHVDGFAVAFGLASAPSTSFWLMVVQRLLLMAETQVYNLH